MPKLNEPVKVNTTAKLFNTAGAAEAHGRRILAGLNTKYEARPCAEGFLSVAMLRSDQDWMTLPLQERGMLVEKL